MPRRLLNSGLSAHGPRRYRRESAPSTDPAPVEVPSDLTTISDLTGWVAGDPDRAQAVLDQENQKSHPRSTLVTELTDIILGT